MYLVFTLLQMTILWNNAISEFFFTSWLLYYFVSLALREHILKVNGSNIRSWWINHHIIALNIPLLMISWPKESETYQQFLPYFLNLCLLQGIVQVLQNRYQQGRLYRMVALGQASSMDVTGGEHAGVGLEDESKWTPTFMFLFPILLVFQIYELVIGGYLMNQYAKDYQMIPFQVGCLGLILGVLAIGNLYTTLNIAIIKAKHRTN
eukprot:TRINITY_DN5985_c0_g1_i1.p1 TRINITY_DN5985_c0_g1~~TRINITY_DN5985_c0_g1_i1.p1  ORF type:complete len:207 (-),score=15.14 TRINITY_DN5985_c0_g1_i1:38-658(-)